MVRRILIIIVVFGTTSLFAQERIINIFVLDEGSGQPVPNCHITFTKLSDGTGSTTSTDYDGAASVVFSGKSTILISYVGYRPIIDTIANYTSELSYRLSSGLELGEVVVTGQNKPIPVDKSIYNIKLIGDDRISQTASNNLAELLNNELNISINNDPSTGSSLKLQGISGENIKILVDGVPVIGRMNGNIDLSQLNLNQVDHVEIVEGPMSVLYGSNALGGVVNIITKQNEYAKLKAGVNAYYESVGVYNFDGNLYLKNNDHDVGVTFGRDFFGGYSSDENSRRQEWKPKEQYFAGMQYKYSKDNFSLRNKIDYFRETLLSRSELLPVYNTEGYDSWYYTTRFNASANGKYCYSDDNSIDVIVAYSYYSRIKNKYLKDLTDLSEILTTNADDHDTSVFNSIVAKGVWDFTTNYKLSFQTGLDINYENAHGKRIENEYQEIGDYALFGSMQWDISSKLVVQPSLRVAYNTKYNAPLVPSLNVKYRLNNTSFRVSYARGFRAPSLKELYLHFFDSNHQIEGNTELKAESSHNFNLAVNHNFKLFMKQSGLKITGFYNNIFNKITLVQVDPDNPIHYRNENIGKYESIGGTLSLTYIPVNRINIQLGVSEIGRRDNYYDKDEFVFSNNVTSNVTVNLFRNTGTLAIIYKYFGEYPQYGFDDSDEVVIRFVEGYHNLDITFMKAFWKNQITVSTGVKNIFDNTEIQGVGSGGGAHGSSYSSLVGWGRTVFFSIKYSLVRNEK